MIPMSTHTLGEREDRPCSRVAVFLFALFVRGLFLRVCRPANKGASHIIFGVCAN